MIKDHDLEQHMRGPFARLIGLTLPLTYHGEVIGRARITDAEGTASIEGAVTDELEAEGGGGSPVTAPITEDHTPGVLIYHGPDHDKEGS